LQHGHYETEGLRVRKNGTTFFANIVFTSLIDEEGKLYGFAKVTRDISEKRKAEEQIRFLASIADNIQDPVISADNNFNITRWNKPAEAFFGWTSEEAIGKKTNELLNVVYPGETREEILISFNKNGYWNGELIYHTKAGKPLNVLSTVSRLKGTEGIVTGNLTIARDITKRKNAEEALKQLNAELERKVKERTETVVKTMEEKNTILESIGDAFFAVDKNWKVTYWNRVAEIALRVPKNIIIGKNLWDIFNDRLDSISYKKYHEAMSAGVVIHFEDYYTDLNKWYEISAYPSGNGLSVYFKDITERKRAAGEIAKLNLELEERVLIRTEQLKKSVEEMEAFSYSVSHDLRAPLRGIIGFANILDEDYGSKLDDEAKRITSVIKKNTSRMGQLIDDLLTFSRTGRQELVKTNLDTDTMVRGIIDELNLNHISKPINWTIQLLPFITADITAMKQVWINLISNAVIYSGNVAHPEIEIGSIGENDHITFFVKDNGVGFDEKYKTKLFKVFQRLHTSEEFEGTGIGLAIVDKVISKHGGSVWVEAALNKGATFYFSLPVDKEQKADEY
jgi:PAS domain S-box-containing protein